jgi:hypothetical protein
MVAPEPSAEQTAAGIVKAISARDAGTASGWCCAAESRRSLRVRYALPSPTLALTDRRECSLDPLDGTRGPESAARAGGPSVQWTMLQAQERIHAEAPKVLSVGRRCSCCVSRSCFPLGLGESRAVLQV